MNKIVFFSFLLMFVGFIHASSASLNPRKTSCYLQTTKLGKQTIITVCGAHDETIRSEQQLRSFIKMVSNELNLTNCEEPTIKWYDNQHGGYNILTSFDRGFVSTICINETNTVYITISAHTSYNAHALAKKAQSFFNGSSSTHTVVPL